MKLRNKKTGEIIDFDSITDLCFGRKIQLQATDRHNKPIYIYNSLAELNAEWEDYEEAKTEFYITGWGDIREYPTEEERFAFKQKLEIGNYFLSREEAELALRKLKAWKRLKDDGLKIRKYELNGGTDRNGCFTGDISLTLDISKPVYEDILQLLFGGEE